MNKYILILALVSSSATGGDIATERTQAATGAITAGIATTTDVIRDISKNIEILETQAGILMDPDNVLASSAFYDDLLAIQDIVKRGQALAHNRAGLEKFITEQYPKYADYVGLIAQSQGIPVLNFEEQLNTWSQTNLDTIKNTLVAAGMHELDIFKSTERIEFLAEQSRTSVGRAEVMQIANEFKSEQIAQLNNLKQILLEQNNMQASYNAHMQVQQSRSDSVDNWVNRDLEQTTIIGNEATPKF